MSSRPSPHVGASLKLLSTSLLHVLIVLGVVFLAYWFVPIRADNAAVAAATWGAIIVVTIIVVILIRQTRKIFRSRYPMLAATETLIILVALTIMGFAFLYLIVSTNDPNSFSETLNRTGALYLSITILSTVGFGDITPVQDGARWLVITQMIIDLALIAGALRILFGVARKVDSQRRAHEVDDD